MKYLFLLLALISIGCGERNAQTQKKSLVLEWELKENRLDGEDRWLSVFRIINTADEPLNSSWELFFNHAPGRMIDTVTSSEFGYKFKHWAGDFYSVSPAVKNTPLAPGDTLIIPIEANGAIIKNSDAPGGMYMIFDGNDEEVYFPETRVFKIGETVDLYRGNEPVIPERSEGRYQAYSGLKVLDTKGLCPITPEPAEWRLNKEVFELRAEVMINTSRELLKEANVLKEFLQHNAGVSTVVISSEKPGEADLNLQLDTELQQEEYRLLINANGAEITGGSPAAVFYGITSLKRLLKADKDLAWLQAAEIHDIPVHAYRGMHLDVARNFSTVETVLELLDQMGAYKLNTFHFHLTDDEGWRIEIPGLEELTTIGSRRLHTRDESEGLHHQYGSAMTGSGSGFYSRETYIKILKYAAERHIEVIPEIDLPGHARAAIVAMKSREQHYRSEGNEAEAGKYLLHDPNDRSTYLSVQNYADNVVNVCQPSLYVFIDKVVGEIQEMHREAGHPLNTVHIGGDEVPAGVWEKSAVCAELFPGEENRASQAKSYFITRVKALLEARNIRMAGWEEIGLQHVDGAREVNSALAQEHAPLLYHWHNASKEGADLGERLADAGYPVVLSHVTNLYFDMAYSKAPEDRGFYWGGFVDTRKVFEFEYPQTGAVVAGVQGQLWSEVIYTRDNLEYAVFPKIIALSERAWKGNPTGNKDEVWNAFANRLVNFELPRLDERNIQYRIPLPGGYIKQDSLYLNAAFPGMTIRYEVNGEPGINSPVYTRPIAVTGEVKAALFSKAGRAGRSVKIESRSQKLKP